ncbi:MAG: protein kinase, partial [Oscillospiraceae bacterium]|nr:protein kinase [Oscillospiraceae bacterium]
MSDSKLCFGCMEPLSSTDSVCPHCGYDRNTVSLANYIRPGSVLNERFLVGRVLSANGEGVTYVGYDSSVDCKVLIREYFPERLCKRMPNSAVINVGYEHLAQYKALMAEYTEMNKALARLRNLSHLNPALDMFAVNNTTYAVYEYLEGRTLLEYLKENAGELSWNIVRRIFPPLFTTLSLLHNAGVLHRGLSPETVFVTDKGEIKLTGFCISAVRTNDTELDAELFDGYAAPEQYFADRQQGTWTDVYGICAVLYRILTGCRATDAISRQDYDSLVPPHELNPKVPENVSQGIMQGLLLDSNARVRTITDLVTLLFEESAPENEEPVADPFETVRPKKDATAVFHPQNHHAAVPEALAYEESHPQRRTGQTAHGTGNGHPQGRSTKDGHPQRNGNGSGNGQRRPAPANGQRRPQQRSGNGSANPNRPRSGSGNGQQVRRRPAAAAAGSGSRNRQRESEITVFERIRAPLAIGILFFAIVAVVIWAFIRVWGLGAGNSHLDNGKGGKDNSAGDHVAPAQTDEQGRERTPDGLIPDLIGKSYSVKRDEMTVTGWLILDPEFEFSDVYAKDIIYWQEFEPDTEFVS